MARINDLLSPIVLKSENCRAAKPRQNRMAVEMRNLWKAISDIVVLRSTLHASRFLCPRLTAQTISHSSRPVTITAAGIQM